MWNRTAAKPTPGANLPRLRAAEVNRWFADEAVENNDYFSHLGIDYWTQVVNRSVSVARRIGNPLGALVA